MKIGIGIDTGGTCTDAVAVDLDTGKVLAKGKTETTRNDLQIGIGKALDALPQELIRDACAVALSTTLATNACIQGKGCRAKLVLFGLPEEYMLRMKAPENYNLRPETVLCVDTNGSADGLRIDEPDWDTLFAERGAWLRDADALCAVELWSDDTGAPCEKKFKVLAEERTGRKCVAANELTSGVNIFARGATALLNARLFPIVKEFVDAAERDFRARGCTAPIMVVRSDGGIMSSLLTMSRPVETILSGPAASVLAGKRVSDSSNYIIIDMGGTSTDVSVVRDGRPVTADEGIRIGEWATSVRGIKVSPFNLGGDSAIRLKEGVPTLYPRRVRSICSAAEIWPEIKEKLRELLMTRHYNDFPLHEFFYLLKEPEDLSLYTAAERRLLDAVRRGPLLLERLSEEAGIDIYTLNSERLESEGIIMRCGLTPTDFMHIRGDYLHYDREASLLAARYMLQSLGRPDTEEEAKVFAGEIYDLVEAKMFEDILMIALMREFPRQFARGVDEQTLFLIRRCWADRNAGGTRVLRFALGTDYELVGIGAPTHLFLPEVAKALGAKCLLPDNAEVANAIGALSASLNAVVRVEITARFLPEKGGFIYIVHAPTGSRRVEEKEEAVAYAKAEGTKAAIAEARLRGATGEVRVTTRLEEKRAVSRSGVKVDFAHCVVTEAEVSLT